MQKRLFRESRKLEHTNHIASAILKNVHAYILLIDNDFKVLKTNYYQLTGTQKGLKEKRVGSFQISEASSLFESLADGTTYGAGATVSMSTAASFRR